MLSNLDLLLVAELIEDFAELAIDHGLAGRVVGTVHVVVPAAQSCSHVLHVELQVGEEINVLPRLERTQCTDASVYG